MKLFVQHRGNVEMSCTECEPVDVKHVTKKVANGLINKNGVHREIEARLCHPLDTLRRFARESGVAMTSEEFARRLDDSRCDSRRDMFFLPKMKDLKDGESCTFQLTTRTIKFLT